MSVWDKEKSLKLQSFGLKDPIDRVNKMGLIKKVEETKEFIPRIPDFQGSGVSIWINKDKNGNDYLAVCVLGGKAINCFKPKPKDE